MVVVLVMHYTQLLSCGIMGKGHFSAFCSLHFLHVNVINHVIHVYFISWYYYE